MSNSEYRYRLSDLPGPRQLPLLGNMHQIKLQRFHQTLESWARQYGARYQIKIGRKRALVLSDPADYTSLLRDRPDAFSRASSTIENASEIGIKGVFIAQGDDWRMQRKLVMRTLTPEVIKQFFPQLELMVARLQRRWQAASSAPGSINYLRDLKAFALDITTAFAFGQDINSVEHEDNPLQRDIECIFQRAAARMLSPVKYWRYVRLPVDRASDAAAERISQAITGFIANGRQLLQDDAQRRDRPSNLLEALIVARDEENSGFDDNHVRGNALTMVFAGEDTTSNSIAWLLDNLARHPQVADAIRAELAQVMRPEQLLPDFQQLQHLPLLEAALHESMRLRSVAPLMTIESTREMVVHDMLLPAKTPILLLLREAGMQETDFPQARDFKPERWLSGEQKQPDTELLRKLMPFGSGPRLCPGRFLALCEIKMVVAMVLRHFQLQIRSGENAEEVFSYTMTPSCLPLHLQAHT